MNVVAELDENLDLKEKYIYVNGMLAGRINSDGEFYQYSHDGLGSITMISDSTGEYQNLYVYDDFGNFRMLEEAGSVPNSYYYTGQELDESPSGLYNLRARYYAAGIGRFTQEDPITHKLIHVTGILGADMFTELFGTLSPQDLHDYLYVANNPTNVIDPFGLCAQKQAEPPKRPPREDCLKVFIDCMAYNIIGPGWGSFVTATGEGVGYWATAKAWQHAAKRMLRYPLKSSIFRNKMFWGKNLGPLVTLSYILFAEEYCLFKEIECLQEQEYQSREQTYRGYR